MGIWTFIISRCWFSDTSLVNVIFIRLESFNVDLSFPLVKIIDLSLNVAECEPEVIFVSLSVIANFADFVLCMKLRQFCFRRSIC